MSIQITVPPESATIRSVSRFYAAELVPRSLLIGTTSILAGIEVKFDIDNNFANQDLFQAVTKIVVEFLWFPVANIIGESF